MSEVETTVQTAIDSGAKLIRLVDSRSRVFLIPVASFAYIEVGSELSRRVGFVA